MNAVVVGTAVFGCVFGGAMLGVALRRTLPAAHVNEESKELARAAMGMIGTVAALVLGLLLASAASSFDTQRGEVAHFAARVLLLDRALAHYGPETKPIRDQLQRFVVTTLGDMWPKNGPGQTKNPGEVGGRVYDAIQDLSPVNDSQRAIKEQASQMVIETGEIRFLMLAQRGRTISMVFVAVLVFWLTITFIGFGLFTPFNATVAAMLLACSLSVAGAMFLILEMDEPFGGVIQISDAPLRETLGRLGK